MENRKLYKSRNGYIVEYEILDNYDIKNNDENCLILKDTSCIDHNNCIIKVNKTSNCIVNINNDIIDLGNTYILDEETPFLNDSAKDNFYCHTREPFFETELNAKCWVIYDNLKDYKQHIEELNLSLCELKDNSEKKKNTKYKFIYHNPCVGHTYYCLDKNGTKINIKPIKVIFTKTYYFGDGDSRNISIYSFSDIDDEYNEPIEGIIDNGIFCFNDSNVFDEYKFIFETETDAENYYNSINIKKLKKEIDKINKSIENYNKLITKAIKEYNEIFKK